MKRVIRASTGPIMYVIKDRSGNQLSAPNADDNELWDRVASMEARGKRGLSVVAYVPQEGSANPGSWLDVYKQFEAAAEAIINKYGFDHAKINRAVNKIYQQGKGSHAYDEAWLRWNDYSEENLEDDEDINSNQKVQANEVSSELTPALDEFLQDIAQSTECIDYNDIVDHEFTKQDINRLKYLRRKWINEAEGYDDEELFALAKKVAAIFGKSDVDSAVAVGVGAEVDLADAMEDMLYEVYQNYYSDWLDGKYTDDDIVQLFKEHMVEEYDAAGDDLDLSDAARDYAEAHISDYFN